MRHRGWLVIAAASLMSSCGNSAGRDARAETTRFGPIDLTRPVDVAKLPGATWQTYGPTGSVLDVAGDTISLVFDETRQVIEISTACPKVKTRHGVEVGDSTGAFALKVLDARCDFETDADGNLECRSASDRSIHYLLGPYPYYSVTTQTKLADLPDMTVRQIQWIAPKPLAASSLPPPPPTSDAVERCARTYVTARRCQRSTYLDATGWDEVGSPALPPIDLAQARSDCDFSSPPAPPYPNEIVVRLEAAKDCTEWLAVVKAAEATKPATGWLPTYDPYVCRGKP